MFNLLISGNKTAWETDQMMRMDVGRFKEYSPGVEAHRINENDPDSLRELEGVPALLLYEQCLDTAPTDEIRFGRVREIRLERRELVFRFTEEGRFSRQTFSEFATRLGVVESFEHNRTHWAVKDGGIPRDMMERLIRVYDVEFSFAGANRVYVEEVARIVKSKGTSVFLDSIEQPSLWGTHLGESLTDIYSQRARYCVMFISRQYADREWTNHERRAALDRQINERRPYILPCRFDDTQLPGISSSISYIPLNEMTPENLAELIVRKVGR